MSFRYKSAMLSLVSLALIYGWFFLTLVQDWRVPTPVLLARLAGTVLLTAIVQIVGHAIIALTSRERYGAMDERERGFDRRATGIGYYILITGALVGIATLHLGADGPQLAYAVLLAIVIAECVRQAMFLVLHHRAV